MANLLQSVLCPCATQADRLPPPRPPCAGRRRWPQHTRLETAAPLSVKTLLASGLTCRKTLLEAGQLGGGRLAAGLRPHAASAGMRCGPTAELPGSVRALFSTFRTSPLLFKSTNSGHELGATHLLGSAISREPRDLGLTSRFSAQALSHNPLRHASQSADVRRRAAAGDGGRRSGGAGAGRHAAAAGAAAGPVLAWQQRRRAGGATAGTESARWPLARERSLCQRLCHLPPLHCPGSPSPPWRERRVCPRLHPTPLHAVNQPTFGHACRRLAHAPPSSDLPCLCSGCRGLPAPPPSLGRAAAA